MTSITQIETAMNEILNERANVLAKESGAIQRVRKFRGADLLQTLVFGWMQHPDASLETLSSMATIREVSVSDTAVDHRFTPTCADFFHAVLEALLTVVVQADEVVPPKVLRRWAAVVLEDSRTIVLPDELAQLWRGCGGNQAHTSAALKRHVRWELKQGRLWGPALTDGRCSDHRSPLAQEALPQGRLYVSDLGDFGLQEIAQRQRQQRFTLTRLQAGTVLLDPKRPRDVQRVKLISIDAKVFFLPLLTSRRQRQ
jgi:hypothetical protein